MAPGDTSTSSASRTPAAFALRIWRRDLVRCRHSAQHRLPFSMRTHRVLAPRATALCPRYRDVVITRPLPTPRPGDAVRCPRPARQTGDRNVPRRAATGPLLRPPGAPSSADNTAAGQTSNLTLSFDAEQTANNSGSTVLPVLPAGTATPAPTTSRTTPVSPETKRNHERAYLLAHWRPPDPAHRGRRSVAATAPRRSDPPRRPA